MGPSDLAVTHCAGAKPLRDAQEIFAPRVAGSSPAGIAIGFLLLQFQSVAAILASTTGFLATGCCRFVSCTVVTFNIAASAARA
jgi:hypothetical protein